MSDKIIADQVTPEELKDLFKELYPEMDIEDNCLTVVNKNGLLISVYVDQQEKIIRWICSAKVIADLSELELARLCKKYNDQERLICCFLNYDIDEEHNSRLIGFSMDLAFSHGLSIGHLFDTVVEYEWSCMTVLDELIEEGLLNPEDL